MDERNVGHEEFLQEVQKQLQYWQQVLRLQDWNVDLRVVRLHTMKDWETLAQCSFFLGRKDAIINILDPRDLELIQDRFINNEEKDYDLSIVHELLHLHFAPFGEDEGSARDVMQEQAINCIAEALVRMYREHVQPKPPAESASTETNGHYI